MDARARWAALGAVLGATFVGTLNNSVSNVAVPTVSDEFDIGVSTGVLFVSSFVLAIAILMPLTGRLADVYGVRRVFDLGLVLFAASSLLIAIAPLFPLVVVGRAFQGISGAPVLPCVLILIGRLFPRGERGRAVGAWAAVNAAALAAGPALGGPMIEALGWRALFFLDVPAVILVLLLVRRYVPAIDGAGDGAFDVYGAALGTGWLLAVTLLVTNITRWDVSDARVIGLAAAIIALPFLLVRQERRAASPFLDFGLFRRRGFAALAACAGLQMVALFAVSLAVPVFLVDGRGFGEGTAGLVTAVLPATMLIGAPVAGALADRYSGRSLVSAGGVLVVLGTLVLLARPTITGMLLGGMAVIGIGVSAIQSPATAGATEAVRDEERGIALGLYNSLRFVAGGLGAAAAAIAFEAAAGTIDDARQTLELPAAVSGFRAAVVLATAAGVGVLLVGRLIPRSLGDLSPRGLYKSRLQDTVYEDRQEGA